MAKKKARKKNNPETTTDDGKDQESADQEADSKDQTEGTDDPTEVGEDKLDDLASQEISKSERQSGLRFELVADEDGDWHWMLFARNGRPVATNVEPYERRNDAERSISRFVADARVAQRRILVRLS